MNAQQPEIQIPMKAIRMVLLGLAVAWLGFFALKLIFGGFFVIPADSMGVKTRFGAYVETIGPGPHFAIPFVYKIQSVRTARLNKLEFGFGSPDATNTFQTDAKPRDSESMITGDLNRALVRWVVQYRISDPKRYLFNAVNPEDTLRDVSESVMREVVGDRTVDEVLTIGRHDVEATALERIRAIASEYGLGFDVAQVQLALVSPPEGVQDAFNEVNQAQQEKQTAITQAWAEYNAVVPKVRGQADQRLLQAEAYAVRRINDATGDAEKFSLLLTEYRKAPEVTRRRLYLETMNTIMPALQKKVIVDESVKGIVPLMNLSQP